MKILVSLWLFGAFASAIASDCGAPFAILFTVDTALAVSAVYIWYKYSRIVEQKEQRRLSQCREKLAKK